MIWFSCYPFNESKRFHCPFWETKRKYTTNTIVLRIGTCIRSKCKENVKDYQVFDDKVIVTTVLR